MRKMWIFMVLLAVLAATTAKAESVWDMAESDQYGTKAGGMLGRGFINAASCFVDLFVQTVEKTQDGPPLVGTLTGIGAGAGCTVLRAGSGILDVASFWVPGFNGIPVSRSYSNCLAQDHSTNYTSQQQNYIAPATTTSYSAPSASAKQPSSWESSSGTSNNTMKYVKK